MWYVVLLTLRLIYYACSLPVTVGCEQWLKYCCPSSWSWWLCPPPWGSQRRSPQRRRRGFLRLCPEVRLLGLGQSIASVSQINVCCELCSCISALQAWLGTTCLHGILIYCTTRFVWALWCVGICLNLVYRLFLRMG